MDNLFKRFLYGSLSSYFSMLTNIILNIALVPLMINNLGNEQYGAYVTILSIFSFMAIADLGSSQSVTKIISEKSNNLKIEEYLTKTLISTAFFTNLLISILVFILNTLLSSKIVGLLNIDGIRHSTLINIFILLSINFFLTFNISLFKNILIGYKYVAIVNITNAVKNVANFILLILYFRSNTALEGIIVVQILSMLIYTVILLINIRVKKIKYYINIKYFSYQTVKKIFKPGAYYLIIQSAGLIANNMDNLVISYFLASAAVVVYSSTYRITNIMMQLVFTLVDNLFPFIAHMNGKKREEGIKNLFLISEKYSAFIGIIMMFILIYFGDNLLSIWIGKNNTMGQSSMIFFGLLLFLNIFNHIPLIFLQSMGLHNNVAKIAIIEAILNLFLSIVFVKITMKPIGVIMGTVFADVFLMLWYATKNAIKSLNISLKELVSELKPTIMLLSYLTVGLVMANYITNKSRYAFILKAIIFILSVISVIYKYKLFNYKDLRKFKNNINCKEDTYE